MALASRVSDEEERDPVLTALLNAVYIFAKSRDGKLEERVRTNTANF